MAAGLGFKTFDTGDVLSAADTNGYLMQGVLVFANSAARASAITSPQEGQFSFLKDTNSTEYYTGSAWAAVGGGGGGGKVLQVVMGEYSTATTIASTTYTNTGLSASITPSSSSSKILILVSQPLFVYCTSGSDSGAGLIITRDGTAITSSSKNMIEMDTGAAGSRSTGQIPNRNYLDSPATTSSITYRTQSAVYATSNGRAIIAQFESTTAQIILMEIGA